MRAAAVCDFSGFQQQTSDQSFSTKPDRLMANVDPALIQHILHIPE